MVQSKHPPSVGWLSAVYPVFSGSWHMLESSYNVKSFVSITSSGTWSSLSSQLISSLILINWLSPGDCGCGPRVSGRMWPCQRPRGQLCLLPAPFTFHLLLAWALVLISGLLFHLCHFQSVPVLIIHFYEMSCEFDPWETTQPNTAVCVWTEIITVQWPTSDLKEVMWSLIMMRFYYLRSDLWIEVSSKVCSLCSYSEWICRSNKFEPWCGVGGLVLKPW